MLIEGKVNVEYVGLCDDSDGGVEISKDGVVLESVYYHASEEITFSEEARVIATEALWYLGRYSDSEFFCERLIIPKNIERIEPGAFYALDNAYTVTVDEENSVYTAKDNVIFTKDMKKLVWCPPQIDGWGGTYVVPEGTEEILPLAFGNSTIETIVLPESLKKWHQIDKDSGIEGWFLLEDCIGLETIIGTPGSYAEELAEEAGIEFVDIEDWGDSENDDFEDDDSDPDEEE